MQKVYEPFVSPIAEEIWDMKYRWKDAYGNPKEYSIEETWRRLAKAVSDHYQNKGAKGYDFDYFYKALSDFKFLPGGRITSGLGTDRKNVTLFNCFISGTIEDSLDSIFEKVKEAAVTMKFGGGIGFNFSRLRPRGAPVLGVGSTSTGAVSFMDPFDAMCETIRSAGHRRGAMIAVLNVDHPDIEEFIECKRKDGKLRNFNISVGITDEFIIAVEEDRDWDLKFDGKVYKTVKARELWDKIVRSNYDFAEPGVLFLDTINRENNLWYDEDVDATNPCGEVPMGPYGACLLGSINLTRFVKDPFRKERAHFDFDGFVDTVVRAVTFLDAIPDLSNFPLPQQEKREKETRRMGLGFTGLGDVLAMLGLRYGSPESIAFIKKLMTKMRDAAYWQSIELAKLFGPFERFEISFLDSDYAVRLPNDIRMAIEEHGIRNSHLLSIAPTGTISLYAGNVSSGIEPIFCKEYWRKITLPDGTKKEEMVRDYAYALYCHLKEQGVDDLFPEEECLVTTDDLTPDDHINVQAAVQEYVDLSVSKTINVPKDIPFEEYMDIYKKAWVKGLKGCTTYRPNDILGSVLERPEDKKDEKGEENGKAGAKKDEKGEENGKAGAKKYAKASIKPRPEVLDGKTYKIQWPDKPSYYITINDYVDEETGERYPFELFINSKDSSTRQWQDALGRTISAVFRKAEGEVEFLADELKEIVDPAGGAFIKGGYVPSLMHAIGKVMERHFKEMKGEKTEGSEKKKYPASATMCPKCKEYALVMEQGCNKCLACGYSKCS